MSETLPPTSERLCRDKRRAGGKDVAAGFRRLLL